MQLSKIKHFSDPIDALRSDAAEYLVAHRITQKSLARLADTNEQAISDFLGKRRGLRTETFAKLSFVVANGVLPDKNAGFRLVSPQVFGQKVENVNAEFSRAEIETLKMLAKIEKTAKNLEADLESNTERQIYGYKVRARTSIWNSVQEIWSQWHPRQIHAVWPW
jgi:hypothetical protein